MSDKIRATHLDRRAVVYLRQSDPKQVREHRESTARQYALRERAMVLGWAAESVAVIDEDLGQSGASWHRLLELCALTETLILDEDGLYDPTQFNDRLLLGLKGAMSEAELHLLRARLRGGLLNKARRGELRGPLPVGLVYDPQGRIGLDPDQQVQASVRLLFQTFGRTGTAYATVKTFREQGLSFPRRPSCGPRAGELVWESLGIARAIAVLHNPRYAGAYTFGRGRWRKQPDGRTDAGASPAGAVAGVLARCALGLPLVGGA